MDDSTKNAIIEMRKLISDMHKARQLCEHHSELGLYHSVNNACATFYCQLIHDIVNSGKEVFGNGFPLDISSDSHELYFFSALKDARLNCCTNCEISRNSYRIAEGYLKTLERCL